MADSPFEKVFQTGALPWRKITPLHKAIGARVLRVSPLVLAANTPLTLFAGQYNARSMDRIIGCFVGGSGLTAGTGWLMQELTSGYMFNGGVANYQFNLETPVESANVTFTATQNITAAMNCYLALYNIEIPPCKW